MLWFFIVPGPEGRVEHSVKAPASSSANQSSLIRNIEKIANYSVQSRIKKYGNIQNAVRKESWDWGSGVLMFGLIRAYEVTGDSTILSFVRHWIDYHFDKGIKPSHTDHIAPAATVSEFILKGDLVQESERYNSILTLSYNYLMSESIELEGCKCANGTHKKVKLQWRGRSWVDDLFMTVPFMVRYSELFNHPQLHETITDHFLAHRDLLQCHRKNSNLLKHGKYLSKDFKLWFIPLGWLPSGNVAWARGNGWYAAALADFLAHLSTDSKSFTRLIDHFQNLMGEIANYQLRSGLFPTVLDNPSSYEEVSATALFVYATAIGLQHKWLKDDRYYALIKNGVIGILNKVSAEGRVSGISAGTTILPVAALYELIPVGTYPWGEGSVLMALTEVNNLDKIIQDEPRQK